VNHLPVISVEWISDYIYEIHLEKQDYKFEIGKCAAIYGPDGMTTRPYSISSSPQSDELSFLIKEVEDGCVSSYLHKLKAGDKVKISNPYGWFTPGKEENSIFIGTGTGVSPFLSVYRSYKKNKDSVHLPERIYIGAATDRDLFLLYKELNAPGHTQCVCISREKSPGRFHGHATEKIARDIESEIIRNPENKHFYLCGLDKMIDDVTMLLTEYEVPEENIHAETFFTTQGEENAGSHYSTGL